MELDLEKLTSRAQCEMAYRTMVAQRPLTFQEVKVLANAGLNQAYQQHLGRPPTDLERRDWWTRDRVGMDPFYLSAFEDDQRELIITTAVQEVPHA